MTDQPQHGIFAGLFVASDNELKSWDLRRVTPATWPAVQFKRLESVKLARLEAILAGRTYEQVIADRSPELVASGGDAGPWVIRVPQSLIDYVADLGPEDITRSADGWAQTEEFRADVGGGDPQANERAELASLLAEIARLAGISRTTGKPMFLLMRL